MRRLFYRNNQAQDHLELFLVSAISSLLLLRFYLHLTHYPQVGGGDLHIAHMLYGGLLMMVAIVINLSFMGIRIQRFVALLGGVGFGIFIDELGKFITKDNNYFFQPTIGIIYAIFIALYLVSNFLTRQQRLSSEEYQLNALRQFEEAIVHDMDPTEKQAMKDLLARADQTSPITRELQALLKHVNTVKQTPNRWTRLGQQMARIYMRFWKQRSSNNVIAAVFIIEAVIFLVAILANIVTSFSNISTLLHTSNSYATKLLIGQLLASSAAAVFVIIGAIQLPTSRLNALENFRRATLINIFLTEFFIFSRVQFAAIPGFLLNLVLLFAVHAALQQERHT